jgi:hypothetical protein
LERVVIDDFGEEGLGVVASTRSAMAATAAASC